MSSALEAVADLHRGKTRAHKPAEATAGDAGLSTDEHGSSTSARGPGAGRSDSWTLTIAVLIDVPLFRESVAQALGRVDGFRAENFDPGGSDELLLRLQPDIVLVDAGHNEAASLVRRLAFTVPRAKVVAVAMPDSEQRLFACAEAGIAGLVPWDATLDDVVATLRAIAEGQLPCSPAVSAALLRRIAALASGTQAAAEPSAALTHRELEIASLLNEGLSNKEIAMRLCIGVSTVKNHVHSILGKLRVARRAEATARLRAGGMLR